jgi:hypothetical protein
MLSCALELERLQAEQVRDPLSLHTKEDYSACLVCMDLPLKGDFPSL